MNRSGAILAALIALGAAGSGCACMDREAYSLALAKDAHRYRPRSPVEKRAVEEPEPPGIDPAKRDLLRAALAPDLEPFKPFAYCHHHGSAHTVESIWAVAAAPIEYPATMTVTLGVVAAQAGLRKVADLLVPDDLETKPADGGKEPDPPR